MSIDDDDRCGRKATSADKLSENVRQILDNDRRSTVRDIADAVGAGYGTVHRIITESVLGLLVCKKTSIDTVHVQSYNDSRSLHHVNLCLTSPNVATLLRVCCMYVLQNSVFLMYVVIFCADLYHR